MGNYQTELREKILADDIQKIIHALDELDGLRLQDDFPEDAAEAISTLLSMSPASWDAYAQAINSIMEPNRRQPFTALKEPDLDILEKALVASKNDGRARNLLAGVRAERKTRTKSDPLWHNAARAVMNGTIALETYPERIRHAIEAEIYSIQSRNDEIT